MSRSGWSGALALLAIVPLTAWAHRLDEYLQATRFALTRDRIVLKMDLTPGAALASGILAAITLDRAGRISAADERRYVDRVLQDVVLEVDGRRLTPQLVRSQFPSAEEMNAGVGTMRIEAGSAWSGAPGPHTLFFRNNHRPDGGVYLVNALVPGSADIEITAQQRDEQQREFRLEFRVTVGTEQTAQATGPK